VTRFPLSAIVGLEPLIEALLINAVAPDVGGVLVRGERGTAKSTAVRALAPLLPAVHAAVGETFAFGPGELAPGGAVAPDAPTATRPAPLVELPLGTTLDRLVGSLDLGRALAGEQAFEAGLLARAHRGILYVDEVNLLPDHLVDALLDAAASGVARVEREAVSAVHAARFLLVGTMNAEEGELRPQLLDRFGLGVEVSAPQDPSLRAEIVRRRLAFERDAQAFARGWIDVETALAARIVAARERLPGVRLPERELLRITGACAALGVDGVRGDIVCAQAARALAALDGAGEVDERHVRRAAALALAHRRRRDPLDGRAPQAEELERALDEAGQAPDDEPPPGGGRDGSNGGAPRHGGPVPAPAGADATASERREPPRPGAAAADERACASDGPNPGAAASDAPTGAASDGREPPSPHVPARERHDAPAPATLPLDVLALAGTGAGPAGRRARSSGRQAGAIDSRPAPAGCDDVALVASLRGALLDAGGAGREAASGGGLLGPGGAGREAAAGGALLGPGGAGREAAAGGALLRPAHVGREGASGGALLGPAPGDRGSSARVALREHVRSGRESTFVCLVVDASGSMGARSRLARVKGALIALLRDAYTRRDRVAVIAFRDSAAQLLVAPGAPLALASAALRGLPTGGRTPLAAGLDAAERLIRREALREPGRRAIAVVLTDGRVADPAGEIPRAAARLGRAAAAVHVVDTEDGAVRLGLAATLARAAGGQVHRLVPTQATNRRAA
jgi:magnesium chelatase subunit D